MSSKNDISWGREIMNINFMFYREKSVYFLQSRKPKYSTTIVTKISAKHLNFPNAILYSLNLERGGKEMVRNVFFFRNHFFMLAVDNVIS